MRFAERLRLLRNKRYEDWWHIVFGGPAGTFLAALVAEVPWITANRLTGLSFACKLAGAGLLLVGTRNADLLAVVLLQLNVILDIMDGSIARYRRRPSALGAFLDKVSDGAGLAVVGGCLGYRAWLEGHGVLAVFAGMFIGVGYLLRCYMYWLVAFLEKERGVAPTTGGKTFATLSELGFGERVRYYLRSTWRIVEVGEGDVYFWIGVFVLIDAVEHLVVPLAAAMAFWLVVLAAVRLRRVMQLDQGPR